MAAWIIQDGNYPDFEVGQTAEFAVEFWLPEGNAVRSSGAEVSATALGHALYDTVAEALVKTGRVTVLDIGILVYGDTQTPLAEGSQVAVRLAPSVDPFHYFESLSKTGDVLPLVYWWKIRSILRQTAPFIGSVVEGQKTRIRDPQRLGYQEILKTDAWPRRTLPDPISGPGRAARERPLRQKRNESPLRIVFCPHRFQPSGCFLRQIRSFVDRHIFIVHLGAIADWLQLADRLAGTTRRSVRHPRRRNRWRWAKDKRRLGSNMPCP